MSSQQWLHPVRQMAVLLLAMLLLASCGDEPTGDGEIDFDGTQRPPVPAEATNASDFEDNDDPDDEVRYRAPGQSTLVVALPRNAR